MEATKSLISKSKVSVTPGEAMSLFDVLNKAKIASLSDDVMLAIIKNTNKIKKVCKEFEYLHQEVTKKLQNEKFFEVQKQLQELRGQKEPDKDKLKEVQEYMNEYNKKVQKVLEPEFNKAQEIDIQQIPEKSFLKLVTLNNWELKQVLGVQDFLCGNLD